MTELGKPIREIEITPAREPVPAHEPYEQPEREPALPAEQPLEPAHT